MVQPREVTVPSVVVIGVSGSGKSTVAARLAARLGREFVEGDEFHPAENVAKMSAGIPLTDEDRLPWLGALAGVLAERAASLVLIHVHGTAEVLRNRIEARRDHFMPPNLLESQLASMEPLAQDEPGVTVSVVGSPDEVFERAVAALAGLRSVRTG